MQRIAILALMLVPANAFSEDDAGYREIPLRPPEWRMFAPDGARPHGAKVDLLIHFHGHPQTVMRNATQARLDAIVVTVNYPGLSSVYRRPFSDPDLFNELLTVSNGALEADAQFAGVDGFETITVSSFSAGFGAVRELLRQTCKARIAGVLAADSLYASTASDGTPEDEQMAPYVEYAERAARGEVTFLLTHTEVPTPSYESTRDTADELLQRLALTAMDIDQAGRGPLRFTRHAKRGRFEVWGTPGADGEAHMAHLRYMSEWLVKLPLRRLEPAGE